MTILLWGRKGGRLWKLRVGECNFRALVWHGWKRRLYWLSARVVQSLEASWSYVWKTEDDQRVWNRRLGGEASVMPFCQCLSRDFGYQALSRFFPASEKSWEGPGDEATLRQFMGYWLYWTLYWEVLNPYPSNLYSNHPCRSLKFRIATWQG